MLRFGFSFSFFFSLIKYRLKVLHLGASCGWFLFPIVLQAVLNFLDFCGVPFCLSMFIEACHNCKRLIDTGKVRRNPIDETINIIESELFNVRFCCKPT